MTPGQGTGKTITFFYCVWTKAVVSDVKKDTFEVRLESGFAQLFIY